MLTRTEDILLEKETAIIAFKLCLKQKAKQVH